MRCAVYGCMNNDGHGFCYDKNFVSINDSGKCNNLSLRPMGYSNKTKLKGDLYSNRTEDKNGRS